MRIAINCIKLDTSYASGLSTYARGIVQGFANTANGHQFRLYVTEGNQSLFDSLRHGKNFDVIVLDELAQFVRKSICRAALLSFSERFYESTSNRVYRGVSELIERDADVIYTPCTVLQ